MRILFIGDDAAPANGLKPRPPFKPREITVRPRGRTLNGRATRRGHIDSLPKEDGHVQALR